MKRTNKNKEIDNIVNKAFIDKICYDAVKHTIGIMCIINHLEEQEQYKYVEILKGLLGVATMAPAKDLLDIAWELHEVISEKGNDNEYDTECMACEPDEEEVKRCLYSLYHNAKKEDK